MRKVITLLHLVCCSSIMWAQTKPKTNTQPSKPSKAFTIKYLNEKLSQNCSGPSQRKEENFYDYTDGSGVGVPTISYLTSYNNQDYSITERDGTAYLSCKKIVEDKKVYFKDHSEDYDRTSDLLVEVPINKISNISFMDVPAKTQGKVDVTTTYKERLMVIMTIDNDVLMKDLDKGTQQSISAMVFPSFNLQDEEKMKRAFLNIKSYYKEEVDPFADEKLNETSTEKNQDNNKVKSLDIGSTVHLISMKLQSSQTPDEGLSGCDNKYIKELGAAGLFTVQNNNWNVRLIGKKLFLVGNTYFDLEGSQICFGCFGSEETSYLPVFETYKDESVHKFVLKIKFPDQQTGQDFCFAIGDLQTSLKNQQVSY